MNAVVASSANDSGSDTTTLSSTLSSILSPSAAPSVNSIIASDTTIPALMALANLVHRNTECQTLAAESDGLARVLALLTQTPPLPYHIRKSAAFCLGNLIKNHKSNAQALSQAGGCPVLLALLNDEDDDELTKTCFAALVTLGPLTVDYIVSILRTAPHAFDPTVNSSPDDLAAALRTLDVCLPVLNGMIYIDKTLPPYVLSISGVSLMTALLDAIVTALSTSLSTLSAPPPPPACDESTSGSSHRRHLSTQTSSSLTQLHPLPLIDIIETIIPILLNLTHSSLAQTMSKNMLADLRVRLMSQFDSFVSLFMRINRRPRVSKSRMRRTPEGVMRRTHSSLSPQTFPGAVSSSRTGTESPTSSSSSARPHTAITTPVSRTQRGNTSTTNTPSGGRPRPRRLMSSSSSSSFLGRDDMGVANQDTFSKTPIKPSRRDNLTRRDLQSRNNNDFKSDVALEHPSSPPHHLATQSLHQHVNSPPLHLASQHSTTLLASHSSHSTARPQSPAWMGGFLDLDGEKQREIRAGMYAVVHNLHDVPKVHCHAFTRTAFFEQLLQDCWPSDGIIQSNQQCPSTTSVQKILDDQEVVESSARLLLLVLDSCFDDNGTLIHSLPCNPAKLLPVLQRLVKASITYLITDKSKLFIYRITSWQSCTRQSRSR